MSAYTYSQRAAESMVEGNSLFSVRCRKKLKYLIRRHFLKNEFLYGTILWFLIIFTLTQAYLWRVGY
ncbi:hypothetical protein L9W92_09815 [Pelotomaculum terephthalicicum JT]|uniref:hypothetical protein n=1 Tax=Pelotomaculum TaxID=191373 RepID=UPI0009CC41D1|nr:MULTISPECIES: hypothetical protein [Pelotomaculum]MCG9968348.1 hypothetical protein [Pelotomaculum terephthalicicum JT]OPX87650.1 MAG: hypothetical protein A4E54_01546 [Pelotomaculum sp. PtaB.Bin117]OPY61252.1 MAG: hypothetical protein A4E56_02196 [Pelotomaculum sp. PtaU1.Bin065]